MTKKEIIDKLKNFKDETPVRFMFWKKNGTNAFDDDIQISSRFIDSRTGEMFDFNTGSAVDGSPYFANNGIEPLDVLVYLYSPEQSKDIFNCLQDNK